MLIRLNRETSGLVEEVVQQSMTLAFARQDRRLSVGDEVDQGRDELLAGFFEEKSQQR